jgi:NADH dehydrogenase FAD-containing subunit
VRRAARACLDRERVVVHLARVIEVTAAGPRLVRLQTPGHCARTVSEQLPVGLTVLSLGPAPAPWLRSTGLTLDAQGCVATGPTLQSVSHPQVWAAGDVATRTDRADPKSGVYAVRAGPPLAANLMRALQGQPGQPHHPPRHTLNLLATGDRHAIAAWGPLCVQGRWVWRWKDRIDTRFMARFTPAPGVQD